MRTDEVSDTTPADSPDVIDKAGRRNLLRLAGAAAAGTAVAMMRSNPVGAVTGNELVAGTQTSTANKTGLFNGSVTNVAGSPLASTARAAIFELTNNARTDSVGLDVLAAGIGIVVEGGQEAINAVSADTAIVAEGDTLGIFAGSEDGDGGHFSGSTAVRASAIRNGPATAATPLAGGAGIVTLGTYGVVAAFGAKAHMLLTTSNIDDFGSVPKTVPPTRTDAHQRGEIDTDSAGDLWYCVTAGTPGTWRKLSGATTAGTFHAITPTRVYDSRRAEPAPGVLATGASRTVSVKDGRNIDTGAVDTTKLNIVPAGATAIACNITAVNTVGASGFLTVNPGGVTTISAASVNWSGTQVVNNGIVAAINPATLQVTVVCGGTGASCNFVLDVTGYWR